MFIFKIRGVVKEEDYDSNGDKVTTHIPKIYYFECKNFQKAVTRAKKALNHIHEVRQVVGELIEETETS